jgi:formate/nitrite transporter FocA (FNT family)
LLAGLVFSLGLILVIVAGGEFFTGDILMVMAWASGKGSTLPVLGVEEDIW